MDAATLGKRLKEAYPQYANIPDADLGTKYLGKYGGDVASVRAGKIKLTDIPEAKRVGVSLGLDQASGPRGAKAVSEVTKQGGLDLINKGKTKDERIAIAEEILDAGGIQEYRNSLPLKDLADDKELEGLTTSTDLLSKIDRALPNFQKESVGGVGPIAGSRVISPLLDIIGTPEGREARATPEQVRTLYQQLISGKVVSEQEANRLKAFLPTKTKSETQNREDLQRLKDGILLNMKIFEKGKREGLTANEAYDKYGKDILKEQLDTLPSAPQGNDTISRALGAGLGPLATSYIPGVGDPLQKAIAPTAVALSPIAPMIMQALGLTQPPTPGGQQPTKQPKPSKTGKKEPNLLQQVLNPELTVGSKRSEAAQAVPALPREEGVKLGNAILERAKKAPAAFRKEAIELAKTYQKDYKNGVSIENLVKAKSGAQDVGYLQKTGAQVRGAAAWIEREVGQEINNVLRDKAPDVKKYDKLFQILYGTKKEVGSAIKRSIPFSVLGTLLGGR